MLKINLGSASKRKDGFVNVDIRKDQDVDIVWDLTQFPWPWESESVDEIQAEEFFEHIDFKYERKLFEEVYRILKLNGRFWFTVPDIGKMCRYWVERKICECIPHKDDANMFRPNPDCPKCRGYAIVNPMRFKMAFTGAQKHEYDYHRNVFFAPDLEKLLISIGFEIRQKIKNPYKIKWEVFK